MAILTDRQQIGKYEVARLIKENSYCETYRVEDEQGTPFFLKLFVLKNTPEKMLDDDHNVRSIAILQKLCHKNIVAYVEQGTYQDEGVGECRYVVTNYFSGELLWDKLQREGALPLDEALRILTDVLEGLKFMHDRNLLHNDVNPRNVMLSERTGGAAELIDMSHVSRCVGGAPPFDTSDLDERYQSTTAFAGMYNDATDLFSAVALFYAMLTTRAPWDVTFHEGATRKERIAAVKAARKTPLSLDGLNVAEGYKRILTKGLGNGTCRYTSAAALLHDLQHPDEVAEPSQQPGGAAGIAGRRKRCRIDRQKGRKGTGACRGCAQRDHQRKNQDQP